MKKKKPIEAPAVVHGSSKASQMDWFKQTANDVKQKFNTVQNGKGSRRRTTLSPEGRANWDEIFGNKEK